MAGLVAPWLMGDLVQQVSTGTTMSSVDKIVAAIAVFLLAQTVLTRYARYLSFALGETVLADLREDFVKQALALPVSTVERAGTGDLLTRTSRDIDALGWSVRFAVPEAIIALVTTVFTIIACILVGAWVLAPMLVALPVLGGAARWYLRRAKAGYLRESASYAAINASIAETAEGARTVEALGLEQRRLDRVDADVRESYRAERYTLWLRTLFFPAAEISYLVPTVATLVFGGWLHSQGQASLGDVTAATLYVQALVDPVDRLLSWLDELQVGGASLARLLGIARVPDDRVATGREPVDEHIVATDVRFAYTDRDVLEGIDLQVAPGERIAMVGPSGAGKSTLGRLLAGIHPPRAGTVTVGTVEMTELPLGDLRGHVALVTQEHHVFVGTIRDNLALVLDDVESDDRLRGALAAVDALDLGRRSARRARHGCRLRRASVDAGAGPAGRVGPAGARRPAHARARRGDVAPRPARRTAPGALARLGARGPHRRRDRAPAPHGARRRPGRRGRGRPHCGVRVARRPDPLRRLVRRPLALMARQATRRRGARRRPDRTRPPVAPDAPPS